MVNDSKRQWSEDTFGWFSALCEAGFTDEQAVRLLGASLSRQVIQAAPEMSELMARMSSFLTTAMVEE